MSALVLGMASCEDNGSEPEEVGFKFDIITLSKRANIDITPADKEADYFWYWVTKEFIQDAGGVTNYVKGYLSDKTFDDLRKTTHISHGDNGWDTYVYYPDTEFMVVACYVEEDVDGRVNILSKIAAQPFKTLPANTLNGVFTVNKNGKKVRFSSGNVRAENEGEYGFEESQWNYICRNDGYPRGLFKWNVTEKFTGDFQVLSASEWMYMLKDRDRAGELFAHATIKDKHGIILLPDDWRTPEGVTLKTAAEMEMTWNESEEEYESSTGCYGVNSLTTQKWSKLEYAGAVFLPAAGANGTNSNVYGDYWSSTENADRPEFARAFSFGTKFLSLKTLGTSISGASKTVNDLAIRPVRVMKN